MVEWARSFPELREQYRDAVKKHDHLLVDFDKVINTYGHPRTFLQPVGEVTSEDTWLFKENYEAQKHACYKQFSSMEDRPDDKCFEYFVHEDIRRNCMGEAERPPHIAKDDVCEHLHFDHPYLQLGPFQLENLNLKPTIAVIHNFMYPTEMEVLKNLTRLDMRSTPFSIGGLNEEFSFKRTSKVKYISERKNRLALTTTKRMELATGFNIYNPSYRYAAENYQVMNYGVGGYIHLHLDGGFEHADLNTGGGRLTTAMIYLSDVEAGGRTVFPMVRNIK